MRASLLLAATALLLLLGSALGSSVEGHRGERACRKYRVPQRSHRTPIASLRIKDAFDVVDMACLANVTHDNVANLRIRLQSYTPNTFDLGRETREILLKDFGEGSAAGGENLTNAVWADLGEPLAMRASEAPHTGVWTAAGGESLKRFVRGWGKRTSIGGSKGLWTIEVEARSKDHAKGLRVTMFSKELPVLEGWTLYLCEEGQSLWLTPEVYTLYRRRQEAAKARARGGIRGGVVRAFSGYAAIDSIASVVPIVDGMRSW